MRNKVLYYLFILCLLSTIVRASDWKEKLIRQGVYKYKQLEEYNKKNIALNRSHLNEYVIELDKNWIEEKPTHEILSSSNFEKLSTLLREFNNTRTDALRFYVIVINDYHAVLNEVVQLDKLPPRIDNLTDYVSLPSKENQFEIFKNEIGTIPQQIMNELKGDADLPIFDDRIVYFYARIKLTNLEQKPVYYKYDYLGVEGQRLDNLKADITTRARNNVSRQSGPSRNIELITTNVINAVKILVDGEGNEPPLVDCGDQGDNIIANTVKIKEAEYQNEIKAFASLLDGSVSGQQHKSQYLIFHTPDDLSRDDVFTHDILPDKLNLLAKDKNSNHRLYVVFKEIKFAMHPEDWAKMARDVYELSQVAKTANTLVMVVPYTKTYCTEQTGIGPQSTGTGQVMPAVYGSGVDIDGMNSALSLRGNNWEAAFNQAFTYIPKKHFLFQYGISYELITKRYETIETFGTGHPEIFKLSILVDKRLQNYIDASRALKRQLSAKEPLPSVIQSNQNILAEIPNSSGVAEELDHGIIESELVKGLAPDKITHSPYGDQFVTWFVAGKAAELEGSAWAYTLNLFDGTTHSPPDQVFIKGVNPVVLSKYYAALDAASVALNFAQLDWITDGAGFLIASYYRDNTNKVMYGVGLAIPVATIALKVAANKLKTLQKVGNKWHLVEEVIEGTNIDLHWFNDLPPGLQKDIDNIDSDLGKLFANASDEDRAGLVRAWEVLQNAPDGIRRGINSLTTVSKFGNEGIEMTFEAIQDGARILNKNGDEVGKLLKEGSDEILEISDDFFVSAASSSSKKFEGITIRSNTGETFNNAGFVKNADGSIGFVEDVSSYGSQIVQNTIKQRGALRTSLTSIKSTEDAHHLFPVQSLKENQYVKKGVEGGFEFNTGIVNGIAVEKYVKATGAGRHGPHPKLTKQMEDHMNWWAEQTSVVNGQTILNKNLTPAQTAEYMRVIAEDVKQTISTTTTKLNDLDLGLDHF